VLLAIALRATIVSATPTGSDSVVNEGHVAEDTKPDLTVMLVIPSFVNGEAFLLQLDELLLDHRAFRAHFKVRVATLVDSCLNSIHGTINCPSLQTITF
jgi:hypothetical protein